MSTETPRAFAAAKLSIPSGAKVVDLEPQAPQRADDAQAVLPRTGGEDVHVLGRAREAEKNRAALADEEVLHLGFRESLGYLRGLERVELLTGRHPRTTLYPR
jgi:hypothetical protein